MTKFHEHQSNKNVASRVLRNKKMLINQGHNSWPTGPIWPIIKLLGPQLMVKYTVRSLNRVSYEQKDPDGPILLP